MDTLSDDDMKAFSIGICAPMPDNVYLYVIHMPCGVELTGDECWEMMSFQEIAELLLKHECPADS